MEKKLNVYYATKKIANVDTVVILTTEKSFYDENGYLQDDEEDEAYMRINEAMYECGYPPLMESMYETRIRNEESFDHRSFVDQLTDYGINMIRNDDLRG